MKHSILWSIAYLLLTAISTPATGQLTDSKLVQHAQQDKQEPRPPQESATTHLNEGNEFLKLRRYDKAIESFKHAIRLEPNLVAAHLGLGSAYLQLGSHREAIESAKRGIAINPENAGAHHLLGSAYLEMRRPSDALPAFKEAVRLNPKSADLYVNLGIAYTYTGRLEQAVEAYGEALRLNPNLTTVHYNLGLAYFQSGRLEDALAPLKLAVERNSRHPQSANMLGDANYRLGRYADAVEAYDRLERIAPMHPGALQNRGYANLYLGRGEAAAIDGQSALKVRGWQHESAPFLALLAHLGYRQAKREPEAKRILDDATAQMDPTVWPFVVLRYLRREVTAENLLLAPMNNDQMTEARTYLGMDLSLAAKKEEALVHLKWVKEYGNRNFVEYPMAVSEISRLGGETPVPKR